MTRIVGITLVRDEELFVEQAVHNVLAFCDELILVDHRSRDRTPEILRRIAADSPIPTSLHRVRDPAASHELIAPYAGEDVWVLGVDGDELYDPRALELFKPRLLGGQLDDCWEIKGNVVHCVALAADRSEATGYSAPPGPSMTKLFNFRLLESWRGDTPERLHGPSMVFRAPHGPQKHMLNAAYSWDESPFRCLHLAFLRRSSRDRGPLPRRNIPDTNVPRRLPFRLWRGVRERAGFAERSRWKLEHYRQGDLVTVSAAEFFRSPTAGAR